MFKKNNSGQVSSIDLMVSAIIFVLIFISMRGIWLENVNDASEAFFLSEMQLKSEAAVDSLIKTPGYPADWQSASPELIGLADKPLVISESKLSAFSGMDYDDAVSLLGLGRYDFNFTIDNHVPGGVVSFGKQIASDSFVISLKREVTFKGVAADVVFKVFGKP